MGSRVPLIFSSQFSFQDKEIEGWMGIQMHIKVKLLMDKKLHFVDVLYNIGCCIVSVCFVLGTVQRIQGRTNQNAQAVRQWSQTGKEPSITKPPCMKSILCLKIVSASGNIAIYRPAAKRNF